MFLKPVGPTCDFCEGSHPNLCGQQQSFLAWIRLQVIPQRLVGDKRPRDQDLSLGCQPGRERGEEVSRRRVEDRRQERGDQLPWAEHVHAAQCPVSGVGSGCLIPTARVRGKKKARCGRPADVCWSCSVRPKLSSGVGVSWRVKVEPEWRWSHLNSPPSSRSHMTSRQTALDCEGENPACDSSVM